MSNVSNAVKTFFTATAELGSALEEIVSKDDLSQRILAVQASVQLLEERSDNLENAVQNIDLESLIEEVSFDTQNRISGLESLVNRLEDSVTDDLQSQITILNTSIKSIEKAISAFSKDSDDAFVDRCSFRELDNIVSDLWSKFENLQSAEFAENVEDFRERLDLVEYILQRADSTIKELLDIKERVEQLSTQVPVSIDTHIEALKESIKVRDAQIEALTLVYNNQNAQIASLTAQVNVLFHMMSSMCKPSNT